MYSAPNINSPFGLEIKKLEFRPSENILSIFERPNFQFLVKNQPPNYSVVSKTVFLSLSKILFQILNLISLTFSLELVYYAATPYRQFFIAVRVSPN